MKKIADYIKAHPINIFGIILAIFCVFRWYRIGYFCTLIIEYAFLYFGDAIEFFLIGAAAVLLICFLANIAEFIMVKKDSSSVVIVLSVLFGSLGAFIGTFFNREYTHSKAVKIIFNVQIWLFVCIVVPVLIYWINYPIENPFIYYRF